MSLRGKTITDSLDAGQASQLVDAARAGGYISGYGRDGRSVEIALNGEDVTLRGEALIDFLSRTKDVLQAELYEARKRLAAHGVPERDLSVAEQIDLLVGKLRR